ncbi:MAG: hypothetical protein OER87_09050 [Gammaproteobacteria bacterium]|nr:hypothetical protein [Gammaproteobacteria bacterium]
MRLISAAFTLLLPSYVSALPPAYTLQAGLGSDDVGSNSDSFYYLAGFVLISNALSSNSIIDLLGGVKSGARDTNSDVDPTSYFVNFDYRYNPRWLLYTTLATGEGVLNSRFGCATAYRSQPGNWSWNAAAYDCDFT